LAVPVAPLQTLERIWIADTFLSFLQIYSALLLGCFHLLNGPKTQKLHFPEPLHSRKSPKYTQKRLEFRTESREKGHRHHTSISGVHGQR
jgi:hypothetical protein